MGPGGPHGLQLRWRASFGVRGGFDSLALPPVQCPRRMPTRRLLSGLHATCHEAVGVSNRSQLDTAYGQIVAVGLFAHRIVEVLGFRLDQCWGRSILGRRTKAETP